MCEASKSFARSYRLVLVLVLVLFVLIGGHHMLGTKLCRASSRFPCI